MLYQLPPQFLVTETDRPTEEVCKKTVSLAGLRPVFALSTSPLHLVARPKDVAGVLVDVEVCQNPFAALVRIEECFPKKTLFIVTRKKNDVEARYALRLGAKFVFPKPCDPVELDKALHFVLKNRAADPDSLNASGGPMCERPYTNGNADKGPVPVLCWGCGASYFESNTPPLMPELERRAILAAVKATNGDKLSAARILGISKTQIYRKLRMYRQREEKTGTRREDTILS